MVAYFVGISAILSFPAAISAWKAPTQAQWMTLLAMGTCATLGQIAMTQAYRYARAGVVSTMNLMTAVFSAIWGGVFLGDRLAPAQWVGVAVLLASLALLARNK